MSLLLKLIEFYSARQIYPFYVNIMTLGSPHNKILCWQLEGQFPCGFTFLLDWIQTFNTNEVYKMFLKSKSLIQLKKQRNPGHVQYLLSWLSTSSQTLRHFVNKNHLSLSTSIKISPFYKHLSLTLRHQLVNSLMSTSIYTCPI